MNARRVLQSMRNHDLWAVLIVAAITLTVALIAIYRAPGLSALDEATHIDYVWKLAHGHIPAKGDVISEEVLQSWACRGQENVELPACVQGQDYDAADFPVGAKNYNFFHPPLYYAFAAVFVKGAELFGLGIDYVTAARLASAVLLSAGTAILYFALRRWQVRLAIAAPVSLAILCSPSVLHSGTTVTNDAAALLSGALLILLVRAVVVEGKFPIVLALKRPGFCAASMRVAAGG